MFKWLKRHPYTTNYMAHRTTLSKYKAGSPSLYLVLSGQEPAKIRYHLHKPGRLSLAKGKNSDGKSGNNFRRRSEHHALCRF